MKTDHKFNPSRFCRRVVGRGLNIGLMLLSVFWLTWTVAHAQPMLLDPELLHRGHGQAGLPARGVQAQQAQRI